MASIVLGAAGAVGRGVSSAVGAAGDAVASVGDVVGGGLEDGLEAAGDAVGDGLPDLGSIGDAFRNRRKMKFDINHNHKFEFLPQWLLYACSVTGVVSFFAVYGKTLCCCYWPLSCCGGTVARFWNKAFRKFACPCTNDFMYLTITIPRIMVKQVLPAWDPKAKAPRNLKVVAEYGSFFSLISFSQQRMVQCDEIAEQPLESKPLKLNGESIFMKTSRRWLPRAVVEGTGKLFQPFAVDETGAKCRRWVVGRALRSKSRAARDEIAPGWFLDEIRQQVADRTWKTVFKVGDLSFSSDPNTVIQDIVQAKEPSADAVLEFRGLREGAAEWPASGSSEDVLTLTHWGDEEDLVLVVQVLRQRARTTEGRGLVGRAADMVGGLLRSKPSDDYELERSVMAEIRPTHLEAGPKTHTFRRSHPVHVLMETSASRARYSVVVRLRRCRVEVAPGRGPLRDKVKLVGFLVPRQAFESPHHPQNVKVHEGEISRVDIFQASKKALHLSIPIRPTDTEARLHIKPQRTMAEALHEKASHVPLAGNMLAKAVDWAAAKLGKSTAPDELFPGVMRLQIVPQRDGSSVRCEVEGQPPLEISETDIPGPGTVRQYMDVCAAGGSDRKCTYGVEFRLESATKPPDDAGLAFPGKAPSRITSAWISFLFGLFFLVSAVVILIQIRCGLALNATPQDHTLYHLNRSQKRELVDGVDVLFQLHRDVTTLMVETLPGMDKEHPFISVLPVGLAMSGVYMWFLSWTMCSSGKSCPWLPSACNSCLAWLWNMLLLVKGLILASFCTMTTIILLESGRPSTGGPVVKGIAVTVFCLPFVLFFLLFRDCWWRFCALDIVNDEEDPPPFQTVRLHERLAKDLHLVRADKKASLGEMFRAVAEGAVWGCGPGPGGDGPTGSDFKLKETIDLPLCVQSGPMSWVDHNQRYYRSEMQHLRPHSNSMSLKEFQACYSFISDQGGGHHNFTSQHLYEKIVQHGTEANSSNNSNNNNNYTTRQAQWGDAFAARALTKDHFMHAWDKKDREITNLKAKMENSMQWKIQHPDEAWRLFQHCDVMGCLLLNWKRRTPGVLRRSQALTVQVDIDDCGDILNESTLTVFLHLRHVGQDFGTIHGVASVKGRGCSLEAALRYAAGGASFEVQIKNDICPIIYFDEYAISFHVEPDASRMATLKGRAKWDQECRSALQTARVLWDILPERLGGEEQPYLTHSSDKHSIRNPNKEEPALRQMLRWFQASSEDMECLDTSETAPLAPQHGSGLLRPRAKHFWPVSENRRISYHLGKHAEKHADSSGVAIDITPCLQHFQAVLAMAGGGDDGGSSKSPSSSKAPDSPLSTKVAEATAQVVKDVAKTAKATAKATAATLFRPSDLPPWRGMQASDVLIDPHILALLKTLSASNFGTVSVKCEVKSLLELRRNGSVAFEHLFDRDSGWKATTTTLGENGEFKLKPNVRQSSSERQNQERVAAGWGLEQMKFTMADDFNTVQFVPPWRQRDGGDAVAWLREVQTVAGEHAIIELLGRRRLVLDSRGFVHELAQASQHNFDDPKMDEETSNMPMMELEHMLLVLLGKQAQEEHIKDSEHEEHEMLVPIKTHADGLVLQRATGTCKHKLSSRFTGGFAKFTCGMQLELSTDGVAVPCGASFVRTTSDDPSHEDVTDIGEFVKLTSEIGGNQKPSTLLPGVARIRISNKRLRCLPHPDCRQLQLHLAMVAKVHGFELSMGDCRRALVYMASGSDSPEKQKEMLGYLVNGNPWPIHVRCPQGTVMQYSTPKFGTMMLRPHVCSNCSARQEARESRLYYCSCGCKQSLCESCVSSVEDFKNELRLVHYVATEADDTVEGLDGDSADVARGESHASWVEDEVKKLCDDSRTTHNLNLNWNAKGAASEKERWKELADKIQELPDASSFEEFLRPFVPVDGWFDTQLITRGVECPVCTDGAGVLTKAKPAATKTRRALCGGLRVRDEAVPEVKAELP